MVSRSNGNKEVWHKMKGLPNAWRLKVYELLSAYIWMMISGIVGPNKPMVDMVATIDGHMDIHPLLFYIIQKKLTLWKLKHMKHRVQPVGHRLLDMWLRVWDTRQRMREREWEVFETIWNRPRNETRLNRITSTTGLMNMPPRVRRLHARCIHGIETAS